MTSRAKVALSIALSVAVPFASPVLAHYAMKWDHARGYAGTCGPHAPDIAAHPCTYETYVAEFGAGFEGVGLLLLEAAIFVAVAVLVAIAWGTWALVRARSLRVKRMTSVPSERPAVWRSVTNGAGTPEVLIHRGLLACLARSARHFFGASNCV